MVDLRTETHSRIRGQILRLLARHHPNLVDVVTVQGALDVLGYPVPRDDLDSYLAYLSEIGAVRVEHKKYGNIKARQVVITVQGLKIVDSKEFDSGVNVEP
jgi:hypothetical protein